MHRIKITDNPSFAQYTKGVISGQPLTHREIAEKLGVSEQLISNAVNKSNENSSRYNKARASILDFFGYETNFITQIEIIKKDK